MKCCGIHTSCAKMGRKRGESSKRLIHHVCPGEKVMVGPHWGRLPSSNSTNAAWSDAGGEVFAGTDSIDE